ncbi:integral membrane protein [Colletotrichum sojae]|uniref:Integral membrane protein n=1 Tax=Colletotrichum sojae TaxID=2175907 RepID=A0A8H6J702_9PEZI|nr:integral membrane protein [Colletotrichum sojae]
MAPTSIFLLVRSPTHDESIPAAAAAASSTNTTDPTLPPWLPLDKPNPSEWNGGSVLPVAVISAAVATIFVAMRFYTRARILRTVMWDDWFILASLVFAIATSGGMIAQLNFGLGEHLYYAWSLFPLYVQTGTFTNLFYSLSLTLTKVSILLLYIRILHTYDLVRQLGKLLLVLVAVSHAWIVASILTTCVPLRAAWDFDTPGAYCHPAAVFWGNACLHLVTDVFIFLLPLPVISGMRLPRRQKLGLYFVFCLAFLVCAISIIRLVRLLHLEETPEEVMDITWSAVRIANWTCVEVHAAIVTACLTTLKPLLNQLFPSLISTADTPFTTATAAAESRRRQKEYEDNFSTGGAEATYRRPLTIGTKTDRPRVRRDTFASLVFGDAKHPVSEHVEDAVTPTSATRLKSGEYRLAEVEAAGPLQWPFGRVSFGRVSSVRGSRMAAPAPPVPQVPVAPHGGRMTRGTSMAVVPERRSESLERHGSPVSGRRIV